ncbi:hypothetical protein CKO51_10025 [Rhodopirellula sp. SM50]|nr:hypothetical protein CKO51_10025 [Rhodopirellula sp. SM50]
MVAVARVFVIAAIGLSMLGCRSGRPTGSMVQVTEDPTAVVAKLPPPEQRLATSTTGKERGLVKVDRGTTTKTELASATTSGVTEKPSPTTPKPSPNTAAAGATTRMSLSDASRTDRAPAGSPGEPPKRSIAAANTKPKPTAAQAPSKQNENASATNVDVSPAGLVSASLTDLSATQKANKPSTDEPVAKAAPPAATAEPTTPAETLVNASATQPPRTRRQAFNQTELPNDVTAAIQHSLARLPALPDSRVVADGLAPVRLGTGMVQLAQQDDPEKPPVAEPAAAPHVGDLVAEAAKPAATEPLPETPRSTETTQTVAETQPSETMPPTEPMLAADEDPSVVMNANQVLPASHASDEGNDNLDFAGHRQTSKIESIPTAVAMQQLSEAELYRALLDRLSQPPNGESPTQRERREFVKRHLMVLAGDPDAALESMQGLNPNEQLYLENQLMGLWTMIDPEGHPSSGRRITEALPKFREATRLMATATDSLTLNSLEFCTEIESYGQIKPFEGNRFVAGQQVILYCEIENFAAEDLNGYFQTQLQGSYDIYSGNGTKVISQLLPVDQQQSRNRLRDYFVAYQMNLPKGLPPGTYRLQLTIEDIVGKKYGQSSIPFEIR